MIKEKSRSDQLPKCPSGIKGLDEISFGGLPKYRSTLVTGGTGSGKTIMGLQFLMYGAAQKEPGLFVAFEESEEDLIQNSLSLSYDLRNNIKKKLIVLKHIQIDRTEFEESGEYNLEGLFIQIGRVIKQYKIKRVVLDTIEVLFSHLANKSVIRAELQRLFQWLKKKKVTAIVTAEKGDGMITRYGLEEYVADCVIQLTNVTHECMATRYLRVIKYRGSSHGSNEYPFIINSHGISILPITSLTLEYPAPRTFVSSGIKRLDEMLNGAGYYKGSSVLITGTSGVGKSSFACAFADGICKKGGTCI
ncbi:MAG TPA: circadian clock protein KaiC, partial [Candidatus Babeliales bacterium]|nr:circadian clock protein KaiC [Candidatus Babeliales bacterium]